MRHTARLAVKWTAPEGVTAKRYGGLGRTLYFLLVRLPIYVPTWWGFSYHTELTDVWSFGITAWEILSGGELPFDDV
jgi:serine/threonine protein kinase